MARDVHAFPVRCPRSAEVRISQTSSARRVRALHEALVVEREPAEALAAARGPLLVDDLPDTGWTPAVASLLLRRAGAEGVFPLVLAVQA